MLNLWDQAVICTLHTSFFFFFFFFLIDEGLISESEAVVAVTAAFFYQEYLFWCKTLLTGNGVSVNHRTVIFKKMILNYQSQRAKWRIAWKTTFIFVLLSFCFSITPVYFFTQSRSHVYCNLSMLSVVY